MMPKTISLLALVLSSLSCGAFMPIAPSSSQVSALSFGIPSFGPKNDDDDEPAEIKDAKLNKDEKKIGLSGVLQLITAGMGAPFLGDYQGVDKDGKFMFSLEANNLVDENGNSKQTQMPYFESGWVDPEEEARAKQRREEGFKFPWQK